MRRRPSVHRQDSCSEAGLGEALKAPLATPFDLGGSSRQEQVETGEYSEASTGQLRCGPEGADIAPKSRRRLSELLPNPLPESPRGSPKRRRSWEEAGGEPQ